MPTLKQHTEVIDSCKKQVIAESDKEFREFLIGSEFIDICLKGSQEDLKEYTQAMFKHLTEENKELYDKVIKSSVEYASGRVGQVL